MAAGGALVADLSTPGWLATKENISKVTDYVKNEKLGKNDLLVLDLFSNSSFMGTDEAGMPRRAARSPVDGRYHIVGQLQAAPKTMYQTVLNEAKGLLTAAGDAQLLLVAPFPRYVVGKCCDDPTHIANFGDENYYTEMWVGDHVETAVAALQGGFEGSVFHMMENLIGVDSDLPELRTAGGGTVWRQDDPVHLSQEAYSSLSNAMLHYNVGGAEGNPSKRQRLSSVVPPTRGFTGRRGNVRPPSWVAGVAARGGYSGPYLPFRGSFGSSVRGQEPSHRGGQYRGRGNGGRGRYAGGSRKRGRFNFGY